MTRSKVSITRCSSYESAEVDKAVRRALELIGGMAAFVKKGERVLLKPNMLAASAPEEAVDTHPEFVRRVALLVRESGGIPVIGDSPGCFLSTKSIDEVYEKSGMAEIARREKIEMIKFDKVVHINGYPIARALRECSLVINLPKLKTHTLAMLTGAVKNNYGFIMGLSKVQYHKRAPNIKEFAGIIADIFSIILPSLSIMDGIVGMDGDGPNTGRVRKMGLVLASADAVSLDAVFSSIAGLPLFRHPILKEVTKRRLGRGRLEEIEVLGESLDSARIRDFRLPQTAFVYKFPSWLARPIAKLLDFRPSIDEMMCKACDVCKRACPQDAITINEGSAKIDWGRCTKCFCCQEVCPHGAISVKKNILAKMLWEG